MANTTTTEMQVQVIGRNPNEISARVQLEYRAPFTKLEISEGRIREWNGTQLRDTWVSGCTHFECDILPY